MFDAETHKLLIEEFLAENREALDRIEQGLLKLESQSNNREIINAVFRDMHTIKGNCRMMGFSLLEEVTHNAETLLDHMRDGHLLMDHRIGNSLLGVLDLVRLGLDEITRSGSEEGQDYSEKNFELESLVPHETDVKISNDVRNISLEQEDNKVPDLFKVKVAESATEQQSVAACSDSPEAGSARSSSLQIDSVRLSIHRLDALMDMVGELGAAFNLLKYTFAKRPDQIETVLDETGKQIHLLQDEVLKYRMQPIGQIWNNFHRLVRDLAVGTGKKVVLELVGQDTEVDRNVLVSINELLGHLIRNSVDHGIEAPDIRVANGKSAVGYIRLSAMQKHGQIHLEIFDDGQGIDVHRVGSKAIEKGMVTPEELERMKETDVLRFIMAPGFSTAHQISTISGRGTGMDVVQSALDKVGGSIAITTRAGWGTTFDLRIPQTMAIVPTLLIKNDMEIYAIPQVNIVELISLHGVAIKENIEGVMQLPMFKVREKLHSLIPFQRVLRRDGNGRAVTRELARMLDKETLQIVVLQVDSQIFGLEVDEILEPSNLVIKPMNKIFSSISILAGTALMPDGSISFLVNVSELGKFLEP